MTNDLMSRTAALFAEHDNYMRIDLGYAEEFRVRERALASGDIGTYWEWHRNKYNPNSPGWGTN